MDGLRLEVQASATVFIRPPNLWPFVSRYHLHGEYRITEAHICISFTAYKVYKELER